MDPAIRPRFTAVLLAGGRSVRMGQDKACLQWQGRPLWQVQAEKLAGLVTEPVVIACRSEQGLHEASGIQAHVVWRFDPDSEDQGPAGVVERMLVEFHRPVLLLAVDMPLMTAQFLIRSVLDAAREEQGFFFRSTNGIEPLAGWYSPAMLPVIRACLEHGRFGMRHIIQECVRHQLAVLCPVHDGDERLFSNLNTPSEWESCDDRAFLT